MFFSRPARPLLQSNASQNEATAADVRTRCLQTWFSSRKRFANGRGAAATRQEEGQQDGPRVSSDGERAVATAHGSWVGLVCLS